MPNPVAWQFPVPEGMMAKRGSGRSGYRRNRPVITCAVTNRGVAKCVSKATFGYRPGDHLADGPVAADDRDRVAVDHLRFCREVEEVAGVRGGVSDDRDARRLESLSDVVGDAAAAAPPPAKRIDEEVHADRRRTRRLGLAAKDRRVDRPPRAFLFFRRRVLLEFHDRRRRRRPVHHAFRLDPHGASLRGAATRRRGSLELASAAHVEHVSVPTRAAFLCSNERAHAAGSALGFGVLVALKIDLCDARSSRFRGSGTICANGIFFRDTCPRIMRTFLFRTPPGR